MHKSDCKSFRSDLQAVILGVVDVAYLSTHTIWKIGDGTGNVRSVVTPVGGDDKGITTGESIKIVILPTLNELLIPKGMALACTNSNIQELVELRVSIIVACPKRFTILRVIATTERLLSAVVDDRNTSGEESKDKGITVLPLILLDGKETRLIMVINECSKNTGVLEVLFVFLKAIAQVTHGLAICKDITHSEIHRIAENTIEATLITRNIRNVTVVVFTNGEFADSRLKLFPERLLDFSNGIDTQTLAIISSQLLDVLDEVLTDEGVGLIEIRKARETTMFNLRLVIPMLDVAASRTALTIMIVIDTVERDEFIIPSILLGVTHMISNNIDHKVHITILEGIVEADEITQSAKILINSSDILSPIAMITLISVLDDRANPDSIKAHTLNIVQVLLDTLESSTTISRNITLRRR